MSDKDSQRTSLMHSAGRRNRTGARSPFTPPSRRRGAPFSPPLQCGEGGGQAGGRPAERSASSSRQCRHRPRRARHIVTEGQCSEIFVRELNMDGLKLFPNEHDSSLSGTKHWNLSCSSPSCSSIPSSHYPLPPPLFPSVPSFPAPVSPPPSSLPFSSSAQQGVGSA